jgi:hypothetical protein
MSDSDGQKIYTNYESLFCDRPPWEMLSDDDQKAWDDLARDINRCPHCRQITGAACCTCEPTEIDIDCTLHGYSRSNNYGADADDH